MGTIILIFVYGVGLILPIYIIYLFFSLVKSNKEIAKSQAKTAEALLKISRQLSTINSTIKPSNDCEFPK
jgi:cytochrome c biogenesis protein CcdA